MSASYRNCGHETEGRVAGMADAGSSSASQSSCVTGAVETTVKTGLSVSDETTPGNDWLFVDKRTRSRRDKTRGVLFAVLLLLVMAGVGSFLVADIAHLLVDQDLLVSGDVVLLRSNASSVWYRKLTFSLKNVNSSLPANASVLLFQRSCDALHMFLGTENLVDQSEAVFFNSCATTGGKYICILDQFLYLVDSNVTAVHYEIGLPSNSSSSSVNITVFNSHYNFYSYLNGGSNIPTVKWSSLSENFTFDLGCLPNSSYYFLTIEAWNETVEWFNFTRRGQSALYNVSDLEPGCNITIADECLISEFQGNEDSCFLAELPGERPSEEPTNSELIFVAYNSDIVGTAIFIVSLILCVLVFLSAVCAAVMCFGFDKMEPGKWRYGLSHRRVKYSKIQQQ